ncbi:hypothetical protein GCM10009555_018240 [Acrocarpospora macrocephala]|uniref:HNH nuclease domain-containing protein n=1 Tax=Acrocarpospora macrocephala TaxID=150177 RepID=A0A5M3WES7_9ACTN|nr:HNH endonuclease signature motif containing protein [Acrocarpospora macrocephala]GES07484.1 hypothetical protein Amac_010790 [Acrocarpospora macrocephala]
MTLERRPLAERLWEKVQRGGEAECWVWSGPKTNGYGVIGEGGRGAPTLRVHRVAYELLVGPIPEGLHLDHLCRNRPCVNPAHLEAVTQEENNRRAGQARTHCPHGHELPASGADGRRYCKTCRKAYDRKRYLTKKRSR